MAANSAEKARALEQCERDLDVAIERLVNLRLDAAADADADAEQHHGSDVGGGADAHDDVHPATATAAVSAVHVPLSDGSVDDRTTDQYWIDELVGAMASAKTWGEARSRAARFLEDFVGASSVGAAAAVRDVALWQNGVLKKAVRVQHRLCKEKEAANRELRRQLAACQERARSLETENYALSMYLRRAQSQAQAQGGSVTGRFHPEVF